MTRIAVPAGFPLLSSAGTKRLLNMHDLAAPPKPCPRGDSATICALETLPSLRKLTITDTFAVSE